MNSAGRGRPASASIRQLLILPLAAAALPLHGGPTGLPQPPGFGPVRPADTASAMAALEHFRDPAMAAPYYLEFNLVEIPRRGDEQVFKGRLWGGRTDEGPVLRIVLADAQGREHRFLLQNGPRPQGWLFAGGVLAPLGTVDLFQPLVEGVEVTPFDLQMPFLYWGDARLVALGRVLGRPADEILFGRPAGGAPAGPLEPAAVRAYLDTQFEALVKTELVDPRGAVFKTLSLVDLKKVGKEWIPKEVDVRNESTRCKTRIEFTAAALGLDLSQALFFPGALGEDVAAPPEGLLERLSP
jgi:hypothetical protein